jgi:hypothetical protein
VKIRIKLENAVITIPIQNTIPIAATKNTPHKGSVIHHQDQVINPINFNKAKIINVIKRRDEPVLVVEFVTID